MRKTTLFNKMQVLSSEVKEEDKLLQDSQPEKLQRDKRNKKEIGKNPISYGSEDIPLKKYTDQDLTEDKLKPEPVKLLRLNVGGMLYYLRTQTAQTQCTSGLLGDFAYLNHQQRLKVCHAYLPDQDAYFFERSSEAFRPIFSFYVTGMLHFPTTICKEEFFDELVFWKIPKSHLALCCTDGNTTKMLKKSATIQDKKSDVEGATVLESDFDKSQKCWRIRSKMWDFTEKPETSLGAKIYSITSMIIILLSIVVMVTATLPRYRYAMEHPIESTTTIANLTTIVPRVAPTVADVSNENTESSQNRKGAYILEMFEVVCIIWFTFEYLSRLVISPKKLQFFKSPMNAIDVLSILPFYVDLVVSLANVDFGQAKGALFVLRVLRVLRVTRVLKFVRHSSALQTLGSSFTGSIKELGMLSIFLMTVLLFFSTVMFYVELGEAGENFDSIPSACWWCIITMTTIGYGDVVPSTAIGKVIAGVTALCGIMVMAIPISVIAEKFTTRYTEEETPEE